MKIYPVANEREGPCPWLAAVTGGRRVASQPTTPTPATPSPRPAGCRSGSSSPPAQPKADASAQAATDLIAVASPVTAANVANASLPSPSAGPDSNVASSSKGKTFASSHSRTGSLSRNGSHSRSGSHSRNGSALDGSTAATIGLEDLPPDVLHNVLVCLCQQDVARVRLASKRLLRNACEAAQFWSAKVQARLKAGGAAMEDVWVRLQQRSQACDGSSVDWLQVWSCVERASRGPWHLDVRKLGPLQAPNGVLLVFEVVMQAAAPNGQQCLMRDSATTVLSFALDGKSVEVVVDATGRLASPQQDWCQNAIQLQPGRPLTLALEVSYIFPVPAWFIHPCSPRTADRPLALDLSTGFGSFVIDPRYLDSHHSPVPPLCSGLERLELGDRLCWRQSRMAALLTRFLPGRGRGGYGRRGGRGAVQGVQLKVGSVSAWQVPSDNEKRFQEGYLFSAEEQELLQLLMRYGVLQQ